MLVLTVPGLWLYVEVRDEGMNSTKKRRGNPLEAKRSFRLFVEQMQQKQPLTNEQFEYFARVFSEIIAGSDANDALGLTYRRGQSEKKALARLKISAILHWVACAIDTDRGNSLTLDQAFTEAEKHFNVSYEVIKKYWYQDDKQHMRSVERTGSDQDFPYDIHQKLP